jgi:hypothetical protein
MNKPFRYGKLATRRSGTYITPEKLTTLKMIFDAVCDELAIPDDATIERELLATRIMVMGQTVESEMILVTTAMEAIADHRQELPIAAAKSMNSINPEPPAGREPITGIHAER